MSALKKLVDRCNEMDITEQINWLGDPLMAYEAKKELQAIEAAQQNVQRIGGESAADVVIRKMAESLIKFVNGDPANR